MRLVKLASVLMSLAVVGCVALAMEAYQSRADATPVTAMTAVTVAAIGQSGGEAKTDFDSLPPGPMAAIPLNTPAGTTAVLAGNLTVQAAEANWPVSFGQRAVQIEGKATLFLAGPVRIIEFSAGKRVASEPDPYLRCLVVNAGFFAPTGTLTLEIGTHVMPEFGRFGMRPSSGQYGFCEMIGLVDNIVIGQ